MNNAMTTVAAVSEGEDFGYSHAETRRFVRAAIRHIESPSIRAWARSSNNFPLLVKLAKKNRHMVPLRFGTYLVCLAMGF